MKKVEPRDADSGPRLVVKSGRHHGMEGILYDAKAYVDIQVEK